MAITVVVGAQWGDEGKGKIVDLLADESDCVVRTAGGANAGHTLCVGDVKLVTHLLPSGVLHPGVECLLGAGMVIDVDTLFEEIDEALSRGLLDTTSRIKVSPRAHVTMPYHRKIELIREKSANAIGTTKRGIGPCYASKADRFGIRINDLFSPSRLRTLIEQNIAELNPVFVAFGDSAITATEVESMLSTAAGWAEKLRPMVGSVVDALAEMQSQDKRILLEGAQGAMLDVDHGTYPFVTSSSTTSAGACQGAGVGPSAVTRVIGICKAYTTRVGAGPFPSELSIEASESLRQKGGEYGATTGRPRRCGWLDLVALRHAVRINGITELAITKIDVLSGEPEVLVCIGYEIGGITVTEFPADTASLDNAKPVYKRFSAWSNAEADKPLADSTVEFLECIESFVGAKVSIASVGPGRKQTIFREK